MILWKLVGDLGSTSSRTQWRKIDTISTGVYISLEFIDSDIALWMTDNSEQAFTYFCLSFLPSTPHSFSLASCDHPRYLRRWHLSFSTHHRQSRCSSVSPLRAVSSTVSALITSFPVSASSKYTLRSPSESSHTKTEIALRLTSNALQKTIIHCAAERFKTGFRRCLSSLPFQRPSSHPG